MSLIEQKRLRLARLENAILSFHYRRRIGDPNSVFSDIDYQCNEALRENINPLAILETFLRFGDPFAKE